jgi:hypothetical protein
VEQRAPILAGGDGGERAEEVARPRVARGGGAARDEEANVADFDEAVRQDVEKEAANELGRGEPDGAAVLGREPQAVSATATRRWLERPTRWGQVPFSV